MTVFLGNTGDEINVDIRSSQAVGFLLTPTRAAGINTHNSASRISQKIKIAPSHRQQTNRARLSHCLGGAVVIALEPRLLLSTITVNTFADQIDSPGSQTVSLRDAIALAKSRAGADTINLPAGNYKLALGELVVSDLSGNLTIQATGGLATIDAQKKTRVLQVAKGSQVSIGSLAFINGAVDNYQLSIYGGGIDNAGMLTLAGCAVSNNYISRDAEAKDLSPGTAPIDGFSASRTGGGGIHNSGTLNLIATTVSGNSTFGQDHSYYLTATAVGGGVSNDGVMTMTRSVVSGNYVSTEVGDHAVALADGGGVDNSGTCTITQSVITGNVSGSSYYYDSGTELLGAGVHNAASGKLILATSEISGNTDKSEYPYGNAYTIGGGGIGNAGTATVVNCTITGNKAIGGENSGGGIRDAFGGHIAVTDCTVVGNVGEGIVAPEIFSPPLQKESGTIVLANTIVSGNVYSDTTSQDPLYSFAGMDVLGAVVSLGHNLIGQPRPAQGWIPSDITGTFSKALDPGLSPLGNFGGSTRSFVPLAGSPALGKGAAGLVPSGNATDQRGLPRVIAGALILAQLKSRARQPSGLYRRPASA